MTGEVEKYSQPTTAVERHQSTAPPPSTRGLR
jgi:hypothetical protein